MTPTAAPERHPWNTSFTWPAHPGPHRRVAPEQATAYDRDGYFLLENAFDTDRLDELQGVIEPHEREVNDFLRQLDGGRFSVAPGQRLHLRRAPGLPHLLGAAR